MKPLIDKSFINRIQGQHLGYSGFTMKSKFNGLGMHTQASMNKVKKPTTRTQKGIKKTKSKSNLKSGLNLQIS